jgi:hypothetical protein
MGTGARTAAWSPTRIMVTAAAVVALAGLLLMHGLPLPHAIGSDHGASMSGGSPSEHASSMAMSGVAVVSAGGLMAGPHHCISDGPRVQRVVPPPAAASALPEPAALSSRTRLAGGDPAGALARASPSLDRLCVSRE